MLKLSFSAICLFIIFRENAQSAGLAWYFYFIFHLFIFFLFKLYKSLGYLHLSDFYYILCFIF